MAALGSSTKTWCDFEPDERCLLLSRLSGMCSCTMHVEMAIVLYSEWCCHI